MTAFHNTGRLGIRHCNAGRGIMLCVAVALVLFSVGGIYADADSGIVIIAPYGDWAVEDYGDGKPLLVSMDCVGPAEHFFAISNLKTGLAKQFSGRFRLPSCDSRQSAGFSFSGRDTVFAAMVISDGEGARFVTAYRPLKYNQWVTLRSIALKRDSLISTEWVELRVSAEKNGIALYLNDTQCARVINDFALGMDDGLRWGVATASGPIDCMNLRAWSRHDTVPFELAEARLIEYTMERFLKLGDGNPF
ncbi:MAG: hypothetical protein GF363_00260 [Chitinivibrionales bacterium]|nr:hypothetical protein [Chitinivibrionales bacterium]